MRELRYDRIVGVRAPAKTKTDNELVQIVDRAMAEAARRSGSWLACRPGCYECCIGPFVITQLDAIRLRKGLAALEARDPQQAARVRQRALAYLERMRREYPDDPVGSVLAIEEAFADELCPALDPETGTCDLYAARPITCRTFGPAVRLGEESIAVCELCYRGASESEIKACEVVVDPEGLEADLLRELEEAGEAGETIVACALALSDL
jgi:Fe-S-cluster containining protein